MIQSHVLGDLSQCKPNERGVRRMPRCDPNANAYDENNIRDLRVKIGVLHLVSDLVIPVKFKVLEFNKYKWDSCPRHHLVMFCRKMASYTHDDKAADSLFSR